MISYIIKRLLLIIPTLFGIMLINFLVIQLIPGGPVEQYLAEFQQRSHILKGGGGNMNTDSSSMDSAGTMGRVTSGESEGSQSETIYQGRKGLEERLVKSLKKQYGLDQPLHIRFFKMIGNYLTFDFGESFYRDKSVMGLVIEKMPVSISLGLWTTLLIYLISIPLGIKKATRDGSKFDIATSSIITVAYAIPNFLFAILLVILFAGGHYLNWFPLRGIVSDNFQELSLFEKVVDYFHHMTLPIIAIVISGFASLTLLTKNSFIDQINLQYVIAARAKGNSENRILYKHIFRNAMLIVISGIPSVFISLFFTGSLLIEVIFSLDGLGLLGFNAILKHDYPIIFGTLFIFSLLGLLLKLVSDITYMFIDPRINFDKKVG